MKEKIPKKSYLNEYDEEIIVSVIARIDRFELIDPVEFKDFTEVYSRYFIEVEDSTLQDIIRKYYSDFCFWRINIHKERSVKGDFLVKIFFGQFANPYPTCRYLVV